jgi:riboflavin synthase
VIGIRRAWRTSSICPIVQVKGLLENEVLAMFTGLVEAMGTVVRIEQHPPGVLLVLDTSPLEGTTAIGDSVAISGCCLTVVSVADSEQSFEAGEETLQRTTLGQLKSGDAVNLERSLQVGTRLGGHFVTGHIDCVAAVQRREDDGEWCKIWFDVPTEWTRHLAEKGSIAVDGVSLTVVDVAAGLFSVALIPHTLDMTTLGKCLVGSHVNIETDILAKYVETAVAARNQ